MRVLLVEDHAVVREGLRGVLETYPDIKIVAQASNGEEAIAQTVQFEPDVVIMDINMPKLDGIEATRRITARFPKIIVIGLSVHQASQVEPALLEAGGRAYARKSQRLHPYTRPFRPRYVKCAFSKPHQDRMRH